MILLKTFAYFYFLSLSCLNYESKGIFGYTTLHDFSFNLLKRLYIFIHIVLNLYKPFKKISTGFATA